jgi:hypothetical protein
MGQSTISKQMLIGLNLNGQGLFNVIAEHVNLPNDQLYPPQANMGRFVFNLTTHQLAYCNGTAWINVGDINVSTDEKGTITINGTSYSVFTITDDGDVIRNEENQLVIQDGKITTEKIANNAITNDKLSKVSPLTIKGNKLNGENNPQDLTVDEVKSMLGLTDAILDVKYDDQSIVTTIDNLYRVVELDDTLEKAFMNLVTHFLKPNNPGGVVTLDKDNKVPMERLKTNVANGLVTLDDTTKIPTVYLPNSVGDIINGYFYNNSFYEDSAHTILITPNISDIYVDLDTNKSYRWNGVDRLVEISESLAIGVTDNTAFQGSRGLALEERVGELSAGLTNLKTNVDNKLDKSTYDTNMSGIRNEINNKVNQSDFDTFVNEVSEMENELNDKIDEKADVSTVDSRVNTLLASGLNAKFGVAIAEQFKTTGGTSSQFLKADGSLDSNSYATLNEEGKVEKSILADDLGGREETREEQFTFQPTANDESVKDGLAVVKSIKGNTVIVNQLVNENGTLSLIANRKYFCEINGVKSIITATSGQVLEVNAGDVVIDLTKFFNTGNEPTALEEFERLYPNLPTDYNEGSLLNLNAEAIKSVGFNAFNGEYAKVLGGVQYYLGGNIIALTFKENLEDEGEAIEIPSDNLYTPSTNGYIVATGNDICINLSHSGYRDGEYKPYKESIVNLPPIKDYFPDGMRSAVNAKDEIIWDESIGKYKAIQRVGSLDMGTVPENKITLISPSDNYPYGFFHIQIDNMIPHVINSKNSLMVKYPKGYFPIDKTHLLGGLFNNVYIIDSSYTDVESFKQSLQGQILYYELESPIETIIDDYDLIDYEVSDFGTEEIIANEPTTPIIADIQYGFNAVDEIRNHRFEIKNIKKQLQTIDSEVVEKLAPVAISGDYNDLENKPSVLPNPNALFISFNGNNIVSYDGSTLAEANFEITPKSIKATKQFVVNYNNIQIGIQKDVIPVNIHNCGTMPIVKTYLNGEEVLCKITISDNGDVKWYTNIVITSSSNFKVVIIGI